MLLETMKNSMLIASYGLSLGKLILLYIIFFESYVDGINATDCSCQERDGFLSCSIVDENVERSTETLRTSCVYYGSHAKIQYNKKDTETIKPFKLQSNAFKNLQLQKESSKLQIDLSFGNQLLNQLHFTHLENLFSLTMTENILHLDSCAFASLTNLQRLALKCGSTFTDDVFILPENLKVFHNLNCDKPVGKLQCRVCEKGGKRMMIKLDKSDDQKSMKPQRIIRKDCIVSPCDDVDFCSNNNSFYQFVSLQKSKPMETLIGGLSPSKWVLVIIFCIVPIILIAFVIVLLKVSKKSKSSQASSAMKIEQVNTSIPPVNHTKKLPPSLLNGMDEHV